MTDRAPDPEHDDVDLLLPWYVNGTLAATEQARVRRHLAACADCRDNSALLSSLQSSVRHAGAVPIVPAPRPATLLAAIDRDARRPARRRMGIAAASVAALLLITVAFMVVGERDTSPLPQYETVTSAPQRTTMDYVLAIRFEAATTAAERQRVLRQLNAHDISAGADDGAYRVTVSLAPGSLAELEAYTDSVQALPGVRSAQVTALQLPMQPAP